jgi:hypothetical protein
MRIKNQYPHLVVGSLLAILLQTCEKTKIQPEVETGQVIEIMATRAEVFGKIISLGDGITEYGHCYSTSPNPTFDDLKTLLGPANTIES